MTFFNTDYQAASKAADRPCGAFALQGNGSLSFTAPITVHTTTLTGYLNMLYWQNDTCTESFKYAGSSSGASWGSTGLIYLPTAEINVTGGGDFGSVQIIVDRFSYSGSQDVTINYTPYAKTPKPVVKLFE